MVKLKCGLEIHGELEGKKLFCDCPTIIRQDVPSYTFTRKLRASVGETGAADVAALREAQKKRIFTYEAFDTTCLVEADDEPPHSINKDALKTALTIARLTGAWIPDVVQVMRKIVVDGSNTSGFQRTALVGLNGMLDGISIQSVMLEEDAARITGVDTYRLDRLGIPLIEVATGPDISSAVQARDVAEKIGLLIRSTGMAKRGLGTVRQDINISIEGGERIEIKGAQDLKLVPVLIDNEVSRQVALLDIKRELLSRGVSEVSSVVVDLTGVLVHSQSKVLKSAVLNKGKVLAVKLLGFAGLIGKQTQPGKRLGTEFSERAKVHAGVGGIFHSDELPNYGITEEEVRIIRSELKCGVKDAFVLCADVEFKARGALNEVLKRADECVVGVPREVRNANPDGTSSYMRPVPGAARMYPETDIPVIFISKDLLAVPLPERIEVKAENFVKLGLSRDLAEKVARSPRVILFESLVSELSGLSPSFIVDVIVGAERAIKSQFGVDVSLSDDSLAKVLRAVNSGVLAKESVLVVLKEKDVDVALANNKLLSDVELEKRVKAIISKNPGVPISALTGLTMKELRGKAQGSKIVEFVNKFAKK